jgi:WD40 repeat protein
MNNDLLATGGDGNEIRIWDLKNKKCEHTIHSDRTGFLGMHFNESQQKLLTGSFNGTLKVWDMNIPKLRDMNNVTVKELKHSMMVKGVDYSDCVEKGELFERAVSSGSFQSTSCRISIEAHMGAILSIDTHDDLVVSGGHGGVVKLWNLTNGKNTGTLNCHDGSVNMISLFDDGAKIATVGHDGIVAVHDLETRKKLLALGGHVGWVWGMHLDRTYDPNTLVSSSVDRTIRVWDMHTKKCVETILDHPAEVPSVHVDWSRHRMISTSFSGKSLVHDTRMWKPIMVFEGFKDRCTRLAYSTETVFIGSMDGTVRGFNFAYGL